VERPVELIDPIEVGLDELDWRETPGADQRRRPAGVHPDRIFAADRHGWGASRGAGEGSAVSSGNSASGASASRKAFSRWVTSSRSSGVIDNPSDCASDPT